VKVNKAQCAGTSASENGQKAKQRSNLQFSAPYWCIVALRCTHWCALLRMESDVPAWKAVTGDPTPTKNAPRPPECAFP